MMPLCREPWQVSAPLYGSRVLRCDLEAGHEGRHGAPLPSDLPLRYEDETQPRITWL